MDVLNAFLLIKVFVTTGLSFVYLFLYKNYREKFILLWGINWFLYGIRVLMDYYRFNYEETLLLLIVNQILAISSVCFLIWGTYEFINKKIPKWWNIYAIIATIIGNALLILGLPLEIWVIPTSTFSGVVFIFTAIMIMSQVSLKSILKYFVGGSLLFIGLINLSFPITCFYPGKYTAFLYLFSVCMDFIIIIGTLLLYFQKVREDLSKSEKRFRLLAENARDIVYRFSTFPKYKAEYISPSVLDITGFSPEDFRDKNVLYKIFQKEDIADYEKYIVNSNSLMKFKIFHNEGHDVWIEVKNTPIYNKEKKLIAIEGIIRDVTERIQVENELIRLDQLRVSGEAAAAIAHEIRNPMTSVRGFLQLFMKANEVDKNREFYELMLEEIDRANLIINDYLSLSKSKNIHLKKQQLNDIIRSLHPIVSSKAILESKYIELLLGDIPEILLDENEIKQIILNLVQNGLEVSPVGETIKISTTKMDDEVIMAVKDNGKGIDPEILEKIGKPFYTTKDRGTGLGLSVCYSIADRHNAKIEFETSSTGTTFFVKFKLKNEMGLTD